MFKFAQKTAIAVLITTTAASAANYATGHPVPAGPAYKVMYQTSVPCLGHTSFTQAESGDYFRASRRKELRIEVLETPVDAMVQSSI